MRKGLMLLFMICVFVGGGECRSGDSFKEYLEDGLRKYSKVRYDIIKIRDDDTALTYSIVPRDNMIGVDGLMTKIVDARPLAAYRDEKNVTADKSSQDEFSYYFHSVKKDYVYVLFLRKRTIPTFLEEEEVIEDTTHKILVVPLKGYRKDQGEIELSYYDTRRKESVVINDDYHILLQLKGKDQIKVEFKEAGYNY